MSKLKTVNEIKINGKWVREDKLDPKFVRDVIYDCIDFGMRNQNFVRIDKTAQAVERRTSLLNTKSTSV